MFYSIIKLCIYFLSAKKKKKVLPQYQKVDIGKTAEFRCYSDKNVKWLFNGADLPSNAKTGSLSRKSTHWVRLENVIESNAGLYICHGEDLEKIYFESEGELIVKSKGMHNLHILYEELTSTNIV